jgi:hypothetical protein
VYFNLSCPLEWSKYSCVHQGKGGAAQRSLDFAWRKENLEAAQEAILAVADGVLEGRRVMIIGDSLVRQVFISLGCILSRFVEETRVDWEDEWPCAGTDNCVSGGQHSGFNLASLKLVGGGEIHFTPLAGSRDHEERNIIDRMTKGSHSVLTWTPSFFFAT